MISYKNLNENYSKKNLFLMIIILYGLVRLLIPTLYFYINNNTLPQMSNTYEMIENFSCYDLIMFSLYSVICAPIAEEFVYREIFIKPIPNEDKFSQVCMGIISITVFTWTHMQIPGDILPYLPITVALIFIYFYYDRNIVASILFHSFSNLISMFAFWHEYLFN
ncbi:CPBP family intramembrane glutamic endopeptidase [Facklamia lactis]|uniref:CPBP family intramembrane glutamic endopeptidase n=1 Tax=Facklamia lactis TaxID=2749967 RepID=UPI0018CF070A|nr:CPBP family intramembrane glutamic endopeptidase [Facklamia lactis]MBG9980565.1 CPBP family intramembrane metalloprotease [Facklamia lactis]